MGDEAVKLAHEIIRKLDRLNFVGDGVRLANLLRIDSNSMVYERPRMNASTAPTFSRYRDTARERLEALSQWVPGKPAPSEKVKPAPVASPLAHALATAAPPVEAPRKPEVPGKCAYETCEESARVTSIYCSKNCSNRNSRKLEAQRKGYIYTHGRKSRSPIEGVTPRLPKPKPALPPQIRPPRVRPPNRNQLRARLKDLGIPFTWSMTVGQLQEALLTKPPMPAPAKPVAAPVKVAPVKPVAPFKEAPPKAPRKRMSFASRKSGGSHFVGLTPDGMREAIIKARGEHGKRANS